ncbi:hypothetical protein BpHYR1_034742, partial [Brachionus plicatilis]
AGRDHSQQIINSIFSPIISVVKSFSYFSKFIPITDINNNDEDEEKEKSSYHSEKLYEKELTNLKNDLKNQEMISNSEIAKIKETLKDLTGDDDDLKASIKSLELAIKALGKIKTTFELTRQFWIGNYQF